MRVSKVHSLFIYMKKIMTYFAVVVATLVLLVSCGKQDPLPTYEQLEAQYVELTPYWDIVIGKKELVKDKNAAIEFSQYYKEAMGIINYYNTPGRGVGPGGTHTDAPSDIELLWDLRNSLRSASARTNTIVNGQ